MTNPIVSPAAMPAAPSVPLATTTGKLRLAVVTLVVVAIAETIGAVQFKLGPGKVVLMPMLWALLMAAAWGIASKSVPQATRIGPPLQSFATGLLNAGLLLFIVKLGLTVGAALPKVKEAGLALVFQEFGHALGTLALGLPLALLLGIKREAIGATFSVGREGNIAIISEKYGMASPEGRGVLAEYITGTVMGALFISVLAGFVSSLHIFDPRSLAMGAGVGSGSLMAAAVGAIVGQHPGEMASDITAIAAASNLLTSVVGFYFTLFLSLPLCAWLYERLEPVLGRFSRRDADSGMQQMKLEGVSAHSLSAMDSALGWVVIGAGVLIGNRLSYQVPVLVSLKGILVVISIVAMCGLVKRLIPQVPVLLMLSILATLIGIPGLFPVSDAVIELTEKLNFMTFTTPVLALAGFSVAKDLPIFRRLGWRIVAVSLTATAGTFLGATLIAEFFHQYH